MTQAQQKTVYQHFGQYLDLKNGIQYDGCFKTYDEAKEWRKEVMAKGANHGFLSSRHGVSPYGTWERYFDVDVHMERISEWLNDHEITGAD